MSAPPRPRCSRAATGPPTSGAAPAATEAGLALRTFVEKLTDELAAAPWTALTPKEVARRAALLFPPVLDIVGAGLLPAQSSLGMTYDHQS